MRGATHIWGKTRNMWQPQLFPGWGWGPAWGSLCAGQGCGTKLSTARPLDLLLAAAGWGGGAWDSAARRRGHGREAHGTRPAEPPPCRVEDIPGLGQTRRQKGKAPGHPQRATASTTFFHIRICLKMIWLNYLKSSLAVGSLPKHLPEPGPSQATSRSPELHPALPGTRAFACCSPGCVLAG